MNRKRLFSMLLVFVLVFSVLMPDVSANAAKKIKLNKQEIDIETGETFKLVLKNAKAKNVKWSSDDKKVATINSKGVVKGKSDGVAYIIATYKNKEYICKVFVEDLDYWNDENEDEDEDEDRNLYNSNTKTEYSFTSSKDSIILTKNKLTDYTAISLTIIKRGTDVVDRFQENFEIDDPSIVDCEWENDFLYFTGLKNGKTTVKITNSVDDEIIIIPVEVSGIKEKIDVSYFTKQSGFVFSSSNKINSTVYFESVEYTLDKYNLLTINYKAYSEAITSLSQPINTEYWFNYKLYDSEDYVISSGNFYLPNMYIGGKVKGSFSFYCNQIESNENYILRITPSNCFIN